MNLREATEFGEKRQPSEAGTVLAERSEHPCPLSDGEAPTIRREITSLRGKQEVRPSGALVNLSEIFELNLKRLIVLPLDLQFGLQFFH